MIIEYPLYGKEEIITRIRLEKEPVRSYKVYGDPDAIRLLFIKKRYGNPSFHLSPFQRQYYHRWRNTCFIRKPGFMEAWKHKKDVLQLQQISDQLKYLLDHGITSPEDAAARKEDLEKERKAAESAFNAAKASFYMDHVCQLMRRRKKLLERKAAGENVEKQILALENEIEGQIPLPEAEERFAERREKYDEHRIQMKMLKKQIRLVDQILKEVNSLPPVHELTREQDQIREKEMIRSEKILERRKVEGVTC